MRVATNWLSDSAKFQIRMEEDQKKIRRKAEDESEQSL